MIGAVGSGRLRFGLALALLRNNLALFGGLRNRMFCSTHTL